MAGLTVLRLSVCVSGGGGRWEGVGVGVGAHTYSVGCERTPVCRSKLLQDAFSYTG